MDRFINVWEGLFTHLSLNKGGKLAMNICFIRIDVVWGLYPLACKYWPNHFPSSSEELSANASSCPWAVFSMSMISDLSNTSRGLREGDA